MAKVSVVIIGNQNNDDEYMIRCLNMLDRQTFHDLEVFVNKIPEDSLSLFMNPERLKEYSAKDNFYEILSEVLETATGEYFVFCNPLLVFSPDTIEQFLNNIKENTIVNAKHFYTFDGKILDDCTISIYGKLYNKNTVHNAVNLMRENQFSNELVFLMQCLSSADSITLDNIFTYVKSEPGIRPFDWMRELISEDSKYWVSLLGNFSEEKKYQFLYFIISQIKKADIDLELLYPVVNDLVKDDSEILSERVKLLLAKELISKIYGRALSGSEEAYNCCKNYISSITGESCVKSILLSETGINNRQSLFMLEHTLPEYLFWYKKLFDEEENSQLLKQIHDVKELVNDQAKQIELLMEESRKLERIQADNIDRLEGPPLAEFTIKQYGEGRLGFRTILSSIKAWFKHKI